MNTTTTSNRYGNFDDSRARKLRDAEINLLASKLGQEGSSSTTTSSIGGVSSKLEGNKDYQFLYNFLPSAELYQHNLNINYETSSLAGVISKNDAKLAATKEFYLDKAIELKDFWETIPSKEITIELRDLYWAKTFRMRHLVESINREIDFSNELERKLANGGFTANQEAQVKASLAKIDEYRPIAQETYLEDAIANFDIPFFDGDMTVADAKIHKEMFLVRNVTFAELGDGFYEAYGDALDAHIDYQGEAKSADENGNEELSRLYGYMSQYSLNLKNKFLDVFSNKVKNGTITEESLNESLEFFVNNFGALEDRLLPAMVEAIEAGASFESLVEFQGDDTSSGFTGLKDEFDKIYEGLLSHAEGKKTIADLMREKAEKISDLKTDGKITDAEMAQNVAFANRAQVIYDKNYDLNNDGVVNNTDIAALNEVLASKNDNLERYENTYNLFDQNQDQIISNSELESTLLGYRDAVNSKDLSFDLNNDNVVNGHDLNIISNMVQADLGVEFTGSTEENTLVQNLLNFIQDHAERKNEIYDLQDAKLEEYYESAGETYSTRARYHYRHRMARYAEAYNNMGGAYIPSFTRSVGSIGDNENSWIHDTESERAQTFSDRLEKLNETLNESLEVYKRNSETPENKRLYFKEGYTWEDSVEERVMSSLAVQTERAATYNIFYRDTDERSIDQLDKIYDMRELTYSDYYNNRYGWTIEMNDDNELMDDYYANDNRERNIAASNFGLTGIHAVNSMMYARYYSTNLEDNFDNRVDEALNEFLDEYTQVRQQLLEDPEIYTSSEIEAKQESLEAKRDLVTGLVRRNAAQEKAVSFADVDGDGVISAEELANAHDAFDQGMRLEQILKSNDLGISGASQETIDTYDFNSDGVIDELDYDLLDNAVGYSDDYPSHIIMNSLNKQRKVNNYLDRRIDKSKDEEQIANLENVKTFLDSELAFDRNLQDNYWKFEFANNNEFKQAYNNVEIARIDVMEAIEAGNEPGELAEVLADEKAKLEELYGIKTGTEATVDYLKVLDELDNGNGVLVNKYLTDSQFFSQDVKDAIAYINESTLDKDALLDLLINDTDRFFEVKSLLDAAELFGLHDNLDSILAGDINEDQAKFLQVVSQYTTSTEFLENPEENDTFLAKLKNQFFPDGVLNLDNLSADYANYVDLMVKYASEFDDQNLSAGAKEVIEDMLKTLYDHKTITEIENASDLDNSVYASSGNSRRAFGRGSASSSRFGGGGQEPGFYDNLKEVFKLDNLDSIDDLIERDNLISQLDLSEEASAENNQVVSAYIETKVADIETQIAGLRNQIAALSDNRYNTFAIRSLRRQINSMTNLMNSSLALKASF